MVNPEDQTYTQLTLDLYDDYCDYSDPYFLPDCDISDDNWALGTLECDS